MLQLLYLGRNETHVLVFRCRCCRRVPADGSRRGRPERTPSSRMTRVAWLTDIHLNFLDDREVRSFMEDIVSYKPDAVLLGGDIGEAPSLTGYLLALEDHIVRPIYFVLGNHDFYRGSITDVRDEMFRLTQRSRWLKWLPAAGVVELTPEIGLAGHDCWADGRLGDYANSDVMLNDYILIKELAWLDSQQRLAQLNALGDEAADYLLQVLPAAFDRFRRMVVLLHVPPFEGACWHEGHISDKHFLPHFGCKIVGEALVAIMKARPDCEMTVLCGHMHSFGHVRILPNLSVTTGGAEYGKPHVQEVFKFE